MEESVGAYSSKSTPQGPVFQGAAGVIRAQAIVLPSSSAASRRTRRALADVVVQVSIRRYHVEITRGRASKAASTREKRRETCQMTTTIVRERESRRS